MTRIKTGNQQLDQSINSSKNRNHSRSKTDFIGSQTLRNTPVQLGELSLIKPRKIISESINNAVKEVEPMKKMDCAISYQLSKLKLGGPGSTADNSPEKLQ